MKLFNFRAKVKIVGSIFFVANLLSLCVLGGTRVITDSSDNLASFITNSNGGVWDATWSNIQLSIDNLTYGGTVWVPPRNYTVTETLQINHSTNQIHLIGTGGGTGWYPPNASTTFFLGANCNILNITGSDHGDDYAVRNAKIENIKFSNHGRNYDGKGIHVLNGSSITIIDCGFRGLTEEAILIQSVYSYIIDNCDFGECGSNSTDPLGVDISAINISDWDGTTSNTDGTICRNVFEVSHYCDIYADKAMTTSLYDNYHEGEGGSPSTYFVAGVFRRSTIRDNMFQDTTDSSAVEAIYIWGAIRTIISGNTIYEVDTGIKVKYGVTDVSILGNTVKDCYTYGISHGSSGDEKVLISGNTVDGCGSGVAVFHGGITVQSYDFITGNIIKNCNESGIIITTNGVNNTLIGNVIDGCATYGIYDLGDYNKVMGNVIMDCPTTIYFSVGGNTTWLDTFGYNNNSLFPFYSQATVPTVADNCTTYWHNSTSDNFYTVANTYGSYRYLNWTTTI